AMLEARSVAVVGASARPGSFGERILVELSRSPSRPRIHPVNPRYDEIAGHRCVASLDDVPEPVDLVMLAVNDDLLESQFTLAAQRGDRGALIFGSVIDPDDPFDTGPGSLRGRIATLAREHGMAVCGGGCMGFVNLAGGLRAIGYLERERLPGGPIACVTHSGSVFSALLRTDRRLGWTTVVSSGQELVTTTGDYLDYMLDNPDTRVVVLLLETVREPQRLLGALRRAAARDVPVVLLAVGASPGGRAMVAAHSGALAGDDAAWEALCEAAGVIRVSDLGAMLDTLELFAAGRRARRSPAGMALGLGGVHDSGAERTLAVDVADELGVRFAALSPATEARLTELLDPGLHATNPLDVWGRGADTETLFHESLLALADDPGIGAVALCVDMVTEYDGDDAYRDAARGAFDATELPVCVVTNMASALDRDAAARLREHGIPVLEGTRTGLAALGQLLAFDAAAAPLLAGGEAGAELDRARRDRWRARLRNGEPMGDTEAFALLADYGLEAPTSALAATRDEALAAGARIGYPVVLKTGDPAIAHKSDVGGVVVGLRSEDELGGAYDAMAARLGPRALVAQMAPPGGVELALGIVDDPLLGPLVVIGAGGVLVEVLADRVVALAPIRQARARALLERLRVAPLLAGVRGAAPVNVDAVARAIGSVSQIAVELGPQLRALDINPLRCTAEGVLALDALIELHRDLT
ncbi:MAG: acetate--CoA ligase family protein, partial [Solirubrobacteraceae bacterium]